MNNVIIFLLFTARKENYFRERLLNQFIYFNKGKDLSEEDKGMSVPVLFCLSVCLFFELVLHPSLFIYVYSKFVVCLFVLFPNQLILA